MGAGAFQLKGERGAVRAGLNVQPGPDFFGAVQHDAHAFALFLLRGGGFGAGPGEPGAHVFQGQGDTGLVRGGERSGGEFDLVPGGVFDRVVKSLQQEHLQVQGVLAGPVLEWGQGVHLPFELHAHSLDPGGQSVAYRGDDGFQVAVAFFEGVHGQLELLQGFAQVGHHVRAVGALLLRQVQGAAELAAHAVVQVVNQSQAFLLGALAEVLPLRGFEGLGQFVGLLRQGLAQDLGCRAEHEVGVCNAVEH